MEGLADKLGRGRRPVLTMPVKGEQASRRRRARTRRRRDSNHPASRIAMAQGRKTALTIHLTAEQRQTLTAWQRSTTIPVGRAKRGLVILLIADRVPLSHIADTVGISRRFVYKWAQRFLQEGLEGLVDKPGRGHRP